MIAVILFSAAIIATAVCFLLWAANLDKREKAYKADLLNLSKKYSELRTGRAHLQAREDSVKKQEAKIESEKQDIADQLNALLTKHQELNEKEKALEEREASLGGIYVKAGDAVSASVTDNPNPSATYIQKPVKKAKKGGKK